ncbi:uncharacterized protein LOC106668234 [Cimex lectularius]|uniref:Uncharacterized protein n=1 Tax=Cimex lectularius TaxID=79782 RepID=A0A8I6TFI2_CIMLE|nr:uncharacterized protein LOC106668234 [Cimex lectularius]XP_014252260.1 uncharacterized protein LOC106668234 [Cimex lectularius]
MGKGKRTRLKYKYSRLEDDGEMTVTDKPEGDGALDGQDDNEDAKMTVDEPDKEDDKNEDAKSVRTVMSVSKSYKSIKRSIGSTLSKVDKRKLKHNIFMKKVEINHELLKLNKKGKKGDSILPSTIAELDNLLPSANMLHHQSQTHKAKEKDKFAKSVNKKIRGIKKAKDRLKDMQMNLDVFKSALADSKYKSCPLDVVTESIQDRVFNQAV